MLDKILGANYDKKVVRQRNPKADLWDDAAEIEDDETGEKQWKLKDDGETVPKPPQNKTGYMFYRKWYHKLLFMPRQRVEYAVLKDEGDGKCEWKKLDDDSWEAAGNTSAFDTHRNLQAKKYLDLYSEDDNTKLWIAAYLSILVVINLAGMYIITQGVESGVADAVASGINAGVDSASDASGSVPGTSIVPVAGFMGRKKLKEMKEKLVCNE